MSIKDREFWLNGKLWPKGILFFSYCERNKLRCEYVLEGMEEDVRWLPRHLIQRGARPLCVEEII